MSDRYFEPREVEMIATVGLSEFAPLKNEMAAIRRAFPKDAALLFRD
jgi:hypothetical protein